MRKRMIMISCISIVLFAGIIAGIYILRQDEKPVIGDLGVSVYVKASDKDALEPIQQVVCFINEQNMGITHQIPVVNGSYVIKDMALPKTFYSISDTSYAAIFMDRYEDRMIATSKIMKVSCTEDGNYTRNMQIVENYGRRIMGFDKYGNTYWYDVDGIDQYLFAKRNKDDDGIGWIQTSLNTAPYSGWDWSSESMTVSQNGWIAAIKQEAGWSLDYSLVIVDPELSQCKEYSIAEFFGPISWKSDTELFLWMKNQNEEDNSYLSYTLYIFDTEKEITYPYITQTDKMIVVNGKPFASMAVNTEGTKIAYWQKAEKYAAPVYLTCVDLQTGKKTQAEFQLNLEEGSDGVYEYTYGEETIYLPYYYYIPTTFFVD